VRSNEVTVKLLASWHFCSAFGVIHTHRKANNKQYNRTHICLFVCLFVFLFQFIFLSFFLGFLRPNLITGLFGRDFESTQLARQVITCKNKTSIVQRVSSLDVPCFLMCVLFYVSFIWLHVYAFVFISWSIAGAPSSQALPGFLITAPPSVCVPDVIGALGCGFQNKNQKNIQQERT